MMGQLINRNGLTDDSWRVLELTEGETPETLALPEGDVLFPLAVWLARKAEIVSRHKRIGLLIEPGERVEDIVADLDYFIVIAIRFPKFVDGRGYSTAALLRQRYDYHGELRAIGDVLHDQLYYLRRVGFDTYALKDTKDAVYAFEHGFITFSDAYQAAADRPQPRFRRRA